MVGALWHGVSIAVSIVAVTTTSDDTLGLEPSPRSGDLTTIAVKGEALVSIAAASSVGR